jgi:copper resistance protein B
MNLPRLTLLTLLVATPLFAQHEGHTVSAPVAEAESATAAPVADPHAGHDMSTIQVQTEAAAADVHAGHVMAADAPVEDPHAGHAMPAESAAKDPHAGHTMPAESANEDPHAGHTATPAASTAETDTPAHDMTAMTAAAAAPEAEPPAEAFSGPAHAADLFYDPASMVQAREVVRSEHGDFRSYWFMADQLETRISEGDDAYVWNAQGWYGGDINKLWVKTEGEGDFDNAANQIELQTLWSHAITPWFDFQAGVRHDFRPGPERSHLVLGIQGLAPYQFEIDAAAFLSDDGDLSARFEAEYDQLLTQRLILQPRIEVNLAADDVPELAIGSGLGSTELGLRLRYQLAREVSPYIGVEYEYLAGDTAEFAEARGEDTKGWNFVMGARIWF